MDLTVFNRAPRNQNFKLPSALLPSTPSTDNLSLALHALSLSPNITHFTLQGDIVLSPCFFWPQDPTTITPCWPHLQYLDVFLNITTPEGNWLYVRDPEDSDDDDDDYDDNDVEPLTLSDLLELADLLGIGEDVETMLKPSSDSEFPQTFNGRLQSHLDGSKPERHFRKIIDSKRLNPMLMAMARAARHMPTIRRLGLHLHGVSFSEVSVWFLARGGKPEGMDLELLQDYAGGEENMMVSMKKKWLVMMAEEGKWTVPENLQAAWKSVGVENDEDVQIEIDHWAC